MILSKRERFFAVAVVLAVALYAVDRLLLSPFMDRQVRLEAERLSVIGDVERATSLFTLERRLIPRWNDMLEGGLKADVFEAESQVLHAVRDWSQEAGLSLSSMKPERVASGEDLQEITFLAAATGPMRAVARFLWMLETTSLPVRVDDLQVGSRTEGKDDLSLQVRISTLYIGSQQESSTATGERTAAREASE